MATASEDTPSPETNLQPSDAEQVSDDAASAGAEDGLSKQDIQEDGSAGPRSLQHQISKSMREKEKKIGHRRVDQTGKVTYKKKSTSELMCAIQLGIGQSVGGICSKPERDVLMQDFAVVESVFFPAEGSNLTPAHHFSDYRFKTYAPIAFRYFRELFGIQADDFLLSLCHEPMQELSNPGASGSIFYLTTDDEFIIKTVQHKEAEFLQKLLPGYFLNLNQNPRTLLPKFYGLYCYQCGGKNIRFIVMNNLLPSCIKLHEKYDLKGSTYKRKASKQERLKNSPTWKDLDFMENNPEGLLLEKETLDALMKTLNRDVRVLESFKIMDYSLLVGIHNLDQSARERGQMRNASESSEVGPRSPDVQQSDSMDGQSASRGVTRGLSRAKSLKTRLANWSTTLESIQAKTDYEDEEDEDIPPGGIPARNHKGERLLLYLGIIDILQSYRLKKKLEHRMKALVIDGDTISVHRPGYYATRFLTFFSSRVFKRAPSGLKHSPSKKKSMSQRNRTPSQIPEQVEPGPSPYTGERRFPERTVRTISFSDEQGSAAVGGKPDIVPDDVASSSQTPEHSSSILPQVFSGSETRVSSATSPQSLRGASGDSKREWYRSELMTVTQSEDLVVSKQLSSLRHSPPVSLSESTPTHTEQTEGTASLTTSSPSCSSDVLADLALDRDLNSVSVSSLRSPHSPGRKATSPAPSTGHPPSNKTASSPEASFHSAETEPSPPDSQAQFDTEEVIEVSGQTGGEMHASPPPAPASGEGEDHAIVSAASSAQEESSSPPGVSQTPQAEVGREKVEEGEQNWVSAFTTRNNVHLASSAVDASRGKKVRRKSGRKIARSLGDQSVDLDRMFSNDAESRRYGPAVHSAIETRKGLFPKSALGRISLPGSEQLYNNFVHSSEGVSGDNDDAVSADRQGGSEHPFPDILAADSSKVSQTDEVTYL